MGSAMRHSLQVDQSNGLFLITTEGDATVEGIIAFLDDIVAHPLWRSGMSILLDHRNLSISNISAKGVEQVSDYFAGLNQSLGNGKIALVMTRDVDFGMARAWEIMTSDRTNMRINILRSMENAQAWIANSEKRL